MTATSSACPNCGATITFRWSGAVQSICPYCKAVLVRRDLDLEKVGTMSDLPPTSSPIQLGTEGRFGKDAFVVVGRIIYAYDRGGWNEWYLRTTSGGSAWLSDAQGDLAISTPAEPREPLPTAEHIRVGQSYAFDGYLYTVASLTRARYAGIEGELPFESWDKHEALFADLDGEGNASTSNFATIDYSDETPCAYLGSYVDLEQLSARNLRQFDGW